MRARAGPSLYSKHKFDRQALARQPAGLVTPNFDDEK